MFNRNNRIRKMKKIFQWEEYLNWKNMSRTENKFQEGEFIPISRLYSLCFPKSVLLSNSFITRSLFFN